MNSLEFAVLGNPTPQGSKNAYQRGGRIVLVESSKTLKGWREAVANSARQAAEQDEWVVQPNGTPLTVKIWFGIRRPKSVKRIHPTVKPDLDKLVRAVLDGITQSGVVWRDDAEVCKIIAKKIYADEPITVVGVSF